MQLLRHCIAPPVPALRPTAIGFVAGAVGLRAALVLVVLAILAMVLLARSAGPRPLPLHLYKGRTTRMLVTTDPKALGCDRDSGDSLERGAARQRALDHFNHASS